MNKNISSDIFFSILKDVLTVCGGSYTETTKLGYLGNVRWLAL